MLESTTMLKLLASSLILFASGAMGALVFSREYNLCRRMTNGLVFGGIRLVRVWSSSALLGSSFQLLLPGILPLAGGLALGLDRLSAFFLLIIAAGAVLSALSQLMTSH